MDIHTHSWYLPVRDTLYAAALVNSAGKYAVAAFLCHHAIDQAMRGALRQRRKDRQGRVPDNIACLVDEYLLRCPTDQQVMVSQLRAVAAAWGRDAATVAKLATRDNVQRWLEQGETLLVWLAK